MSWNNPNFWSITQMPQEGVQVDHHNGLTHSAAWRGVNLICAALMKTPCEVHQDLDPVFDHRSSWQVGGKPNRYQTAPLWRQMMAFHALWWGNAVSWIERSPLDGSIVALWPQLPGSWGVHMQDGEKTYHVVRGGMHFVIEPEDIWHVHGISFDGLVGLDFISYIRHTLGVGLTVRRFGTRFFASGATSSGVLTLPPGLSEDQISEFVRGFQKATQTLDGNHKTLLMYDGATYKELTIPPDSAQFLGTQDVNDRQVLNFLGLPAMVGNIKDSESYNSLEHYREQIITDAIDPWLCRFEAEWWDKGLTEREKRTRSHTIKFNRRELQKLSFMDMVQGAEKEVNFGGATLNEYRRERGRRPYDHPEADKPRMPLNHGFVDDDPSMRKGRNGEVGASARVAKMVLSDSLRRAHYRVGKQVLRLCGTGPECESFSAGRAHVDVVAICKLLEPAAASVEYATGRPLDTIALIQDWVTDYRERVGQWISIQSLDDVRASLKAAIEENYDAEGEAQAILEGLRYARALAI